MKNNIRERLITLLEEADGQVNNDIPSLETVADYLVANDVVPVVRCKDCKYLMFSDFYGECSKGYMGIVSPEDYCCYGEKW